MFKNKTFIRSIQCIFVILAFMIWAGCLEEQQIQPRNSGTNVALIEKPVAQEDDFDHFSTGFELTGAHENIECASCHIQGVFEGIPR